MTFIQVLASVAAATVVNVVLLGFAWKWTQQEKRQGKAPWYLEAGLVAYIAICGLILYLLVKQPVTAPLEVFAASIIGETFGAAVVFGLFHAVFRKDVQPTRQRIFEIGMSLFLLTVILSALFS